MGSKTADVSTTLSVKDCAAIFEAMMSRSGSRLGGFAASIRGIDNSGFFTPQNDSPFAHLDDDRPAFTVGCSVPKFLGGGDGRVATLHMYVWDREERREVRFYSPHGLGGGPAAAKLVRKALERFTQLDPSADVVRVWRSAGGPAARVGPPRAGPRLVGGFAIADLAVWVASLLGDRHYAVVAYLVAGVIGGVIGLVLLPYAALARSDGEDNVIARRRRG
jgi:hypothetical protein